MSEKLIALVSVQGDKDGSVTNILKEAAASGALPSGVNILYVDTPSTGTRCMVSVEGDVHGHVTDIIKGMNDEGKFPKGMTVIHLNKPGKVVPVDPTTPGFTYPKVSWVGVPRS